MDATLSCEGVIGTFESLYNATLAHLCIVYEDLRKTVWKIQTSGRVNLLAYNANSMVIKYKDVCT